MANLTWIEDGESRQATIVRKGKKAASSYVKSYKIFGTTDDTVLHADINSRITSSLQYWQYPGVTSMQLRAEQYSVTYLGDNAWQLTISYEKNGAEDGTEPLKRARSFDTTGGTQHITQSQSYGDVQGYFYESRYPSSAPNMSGAIGVDGNGVNGVDVVTPQLQWQETYDVPNTYVSSSWIRGVAAVTGTTNNASFRGFQAGEVLFMGCSGSQEWDDQKGRGPWSLSFRFVASKNVTDQRIGDITGVAKKGHEYLWVRYEDAVDSNVLLKKPKAVYVNKVYKESDFSALGIGTT
ncbi:MAG: hypothetical protein EBR82_25195 [Caulobacteraceae bacterium]|nr:hypothetical protein [Caulobacteraceae bacterium]